MGKKRFLSLSLAALMSMGLFSFVCCEKTVEHVCAYKEKVATEEYMIYKETCTTQGVYYYSNNNLSLLKQQKERT